MLGMNFGWMFTKSLLWRIAKTLVAIGLVVLLSFHPLWNRSAEAAFWGRGAKSEQKSSTKASGRITEIAPPIVVQDLRKLLDDYQPQVRILSPKPNEVLADTKVSARFQVNDLPIFKDKKLGLGPHLHVFLDNQPYQAVYKLSEPLVFEDLQPGTHTIRVFASRPWHESFKNEGAYAQTTFHVFTKTGENSPDKDLPLLTYSRPQASYGTEPIMLDFYLTNAPLHFVAQESSRDEIADWRIRATVNGESFVLDRWQPVYLKGFKPGKNWVQLEYLDEKGNPVRNVFNNTARVITYEPGGKDTLSRLMRGELTVAEARGIVDPNYVPEELQPAPTVTPEPEVTPFPSPVPVVPTPTPTVSPTEQPEIPPAIVEPTPTPEASPEPQPIIAPTPTESVPPELEAPASPTPPATIEPEAKQSETTEPTTPTVQEAPPSVEAPQPARKGYFNRFRRAPAAPVAPSPSPSVPVVAPPEPSPVETPQPEATPPASQAVPPEPAPLKELEKPTVAVPVEPTPSPSVSPTVEAVEPVQPASPEVTPEVTPEPIPTELSTPEPETIPVPTVSPAASSPQAPAVKTPDLAINKNLKQFFDRFRKSTPPQAEITPEPAIAPSEVPSEPTEPTEPVEQVPAEPTPAPVSSPEPVTSATALE